MNRRLVMTALVWGACTFPGIWTVAAAAQDPGDDAPAPAAPREPAAAAPREPAPAVERDAAASDTLANAAATDTLANVAASDTLADAAALQKEEGDTTLLAPSPGATDLPNYSSGEAPTRAPAAAGDSTRMLTLDEAVRIAVARSPRIREAEGVRYGARSSRWDGWGRLIPSLNYATGFNRAQVTQRTATDPITGAIVQLPESEIQTQLTYDTQSVLSARWTVFDGGQTYWGVRQANAEAEAADLTFEAARARIAADVQLAYLDALEAVAQENAARAQLESARGLARVAAGRFAVGEVPELDDLQARLAVSDAEIALLEAESATDAARLTLFENLALPPDTRVALVEPSTPEPSELPAQDELRRRALEESAELAALRGDRDAASRGLSSEKWRFLPSVSLGADWVRSEFGNDREAFTFTPQNEQTFYSVNLSWTPLDQFGGLVADRRRARAGLWTAEARLSARESSLAREVEVALGQLRRARLLQQQSRINIDLSQRQREQASERYRLGLAPIVERLNAEALAEDAERQAIGARYATLRALAELERAAGIRVAR